MAPHLITSNNKKTSTLVLVLQLVFLLLHWSRTACTEIVFLGQEPFRVYISLASIQGQTIYQFYAVESPAGASNAITYSITQNSQPPLFQVLPHTGQLQYTTGSLALTQYTLTVSAMSDAQSEEANVTVTVIIESDSTPRFEQTEYTINVPEDITVGAAFSIIRAFSPNAESTTSLYIITGGNTDSDITIDSNTGLLQTNRALDRERTSLYTLVVRYVSDGSPIETTVTIHVLDINDNAPQFLEPFYNISIPETTSPGSIVVSISANDPDFSDNGTVSYSLDLGGTDSTFSLDITTGGIMVIANLDYESQTQYRFTVTAMDGGSPSTSSTITVIVNLINIDDECPHFENPLFISEVQYDPDNNAVPNFGMFLVTVKAYDPDGLGAITYSLEPPISSSDVLALNNTTGVITLSRIDPAIRDLYILNVSASDSSCIRQSFVPVEIAIGSRNSHTPQFPTECTATMYENPPVGTEVVTLIAMDEDIGVNGIITYTLLTQTDLFTIDPSSGTVSTIASPSLYNRENQSEIYVDIIARDGGNRQDYCQLTITLLDQNDNSPQILLRTYDTTVQSNVPSGTFVLQIEAIDSDNGANGTISYSLLSRNTDGTSLPFAIDSGSGVISTNDTLSSTTYVYDVVVADMGEPLQLSSTAVVTITVASDASFPVFNQTIYSGEFSENIGQGTRILTVTATSSNPNDPVFYTIVPGLDYRSNVDDAFRLTPLMSGGADISVGSNILIDYERLQPTSSFSFFIRATNVAGSSIAAVRINITDVDDSSPKFVSDDYSIFLAENAPIGSTVLRLQATDPDSPDINYRLFFPSVYFNVTHDGVVLSNQLFDSENLAQTLSGVIVVEAFNPNDPQQQQTIQGIPWIIIDVNDNQISFDEFTFSVTLPENQTLGSIVVTLEATDPDSSNMNNLQYFITEGNDGTFAIDSNNVILARRLDFENVTSYRLQVQVTDGQQTGCTQCLAIVSIRVSDIDDEPPVFTQPVYQTQITENAPIGTLVVNVSASDSDSATVRYSLLGLAAERFIVDANGGVIVSGIIDREDFLPSGELVFPIFAEGGGIANAEIRITIADVNDNAPRFTEAFHGRIHENISPGEEGVSVVQVQAFDLDAGGNGTVTYTLIDGESAGFRINSSSGLITSHAMLDREAQSSYTITVQATDGGLPTSLSATTQVTIDIGDDNDNRPFFPFPFMFARVLENAPIGTQVFTVPAIDLDNGTNATITYNLISFTPSEVKFDLNSETGEVTVSGSLDYEIPLHRVYTLILSIRDPQFQSESEGILVIQLLDQNDNAPIVQPPQYAFVGFTLPETLPAEEQIVVARINASDEDTGLNSELVFEISGGNENEVFNISDENGIGVIRNVRQLDHETTPRYTLLITVSDRGTPPKSTTVELPFKVTDVNDEPPMFNQSTYTISVEENSPSQVSILQLNATDPDTGNGGNISAYNIVAGNDGDWFILDPTQGTLRTTVTFDREERSSYTLTVTAVDDGGTIAQTGTASVLVLISDVNDNPSLFDGVLYIHIYALDGRAPPGAITVPNFIDPDVSDSFTACRVRFQSSGLTQLFSIDEVNCEFSLAQPDPPENVYNFQFFGRDGVHVSVTSNISVTVDHVRSADLPADSLVTVTVNSTAEEYFNERLNISFPLLIAGAIGVDRSQLRIVSVHPGYHDPNRTVDITFVAQNANSDYINPTLILSQLYLERNNLVIGDYNIIALPTDPCVSEPCFNQAACKSLQTVRPTEQVARSSEFVLLAPRIELSYECECVPGTSGRLCEINYDDCYSNPCEQNAQCFDEVGGFQCDCPSGSSGLDCSFNPDECIGGPCMNGATCVNGLNTYVCECLPGYYGRECQYRYYKQSATCSENPCQNGATCSPGRDTFTCVCPEGFSGQLCDLEEQAQGGCLRNPCYNGSSCTNTAEGPVCTCSVGFTGPNCRFPLNNCELQPCENGGICQQGLYGSYRCLCAPGFTGENCSVIISACDSNPCRNGGRCLNQIDGTYTCECTRYYHGVNCDVPLLPPDLCSIDEPCSPNATCTSGSDDFTCTCMTGFFGRDCSQEVSGSPSSLSPCVSNPCQHGGTCNEVNGDMYSCSCSVGFTGDNCQTNIDDCAAAAGGGGGEPCLNGGVCQDGVEGFVCNCSTANTGQLCQVFCPDGQEGEFCETRIEYCSEERCLNGGTCIEEVGGFKCACSPEYTGVTCEVVYDCSVIECLNGGMCVETTTAGVYQCNCGDGFEGPNCELLTVSFSGSSSLNSYRAYDSLDVRGQGNISFEFATRERDGLLLYNTQYQRGESVDFIAVEIVGGLLRVGVSQGEDRAVVSVMSSAVSVSDGQWHRVRIETSGRRIRVLLDFCQLFEEGLLALADCSSTASTDGNKSFLDLGLPLWFGGVPAAVSVSFNPHISNRGITACLRSVYIGDELLDLESHLVEENSARGCATIEGVCLTSEPPLCGEGECIPMIGSHRCVCPPQVAGNSCENASETLMFGGRTYAQYTLTSNLLSFVNQRRKRQDNSPDSLRTSISEQFSLRFRTEMDDGTLFQMGSALIGDTAFIELEGGVLIYGVNLGSGEERVPLLQRLTYPVTDAQWHYFEASRIAFDLTLTLDNLTFSHTLGGAYINLDINSSHIFAGGRPTVNGSNTVITNPYIGCLQDIRVDENVLPTVEANRFASVSFGGSEAISKRCGLRGCFPNPCGAMGNCMEQGDMDYVCMCNDGSTQASQPCPDPVSPSRYFFVIVIACVAGVLIICVIIILLGMLWYVRKKNRKYVLNERPNTNQDLFNLDGRDCLVISNVEGGGEQDTSMTADKFHEQYPSLSSRKETGSDDESLINKPLDDDYETAATKLTAVLTERIDVANEELPDVDSLRGFCEEGSDSENTILSSICSELESDEVYTVERLREAGPEFTIFVDLYESLLEEEKDDLDSASSQVAHTGKTQEN